MDRNLDERANPVNTLHAMLRRMGERGQALARQFAAQAEAEQIEADSAEWEARQEYTATHDFVERCEQLKTNFRKLAS